MKSPFCHIEIPAPSIQKAEQFYTSVFGWEVQIFGNEYALFKDGLVGGGFDASTKVSEGGIGLYISVENIPAKLSEIENAGGIIIKSKTEIEGGHGFYASFKDPNGNILSIWSKN